LTSELIEMMERFHGVGIGVPMLPKIDRHEAALLDLPILPLLNMTGFYQLSSGFDDAPICDATCDVRGRIEESFDGNDMEGPSDDEVRWTAGAGGGG
jgi:hypothetical protein